MGALRILPIEETVSFIQVLVNAQWPLTVERAHEYVKQVGWTVEQPDADDEYVLPGSFWIAPDVRCRLTVHSYGVPDLFFHVSNIVEREEQHQATEILTAHMIGLEKELTNLYGQPFRFANDVNAREFRWWKTPAGVWVRINYGTARPTVSITGPRQESEPEDQIVVPDTKSCLQTIQTWLSAPWPLPVATVHDYADRVGWTPEEESSTEFYSTLIYALYDGNLRIFSEDFFAEPDVGVTYGRRGATRVHFDLAAHWSERTEAEAWPLIKERMRDVEAAITDLYGQPEKSTQGVDNQNYAKWDVTPHLSLSLFHGPGNSNVTIDYHGPEDERATGVPINYEVDDVLRIIDEWTQSMGSIDLFDAAEIASGIGWFPEDSSWPKIYYTQVSPPAEPRAAIRDENQKVWLVTFDVAMGVKERTPGRTPADIERVMTSLEVALTQRYGVAEESSHYGGHYRDWDTRRGLRVRIAYGLGMSSVWIYDPAKKATVETFITEPAGVKKTPRSSAATVESPQEGNTSTMSTVAIVTTFLAVLGGILKYFFF
ncbi:DUF6301 family protein [Schaalia canis]|uniref:Uncharacterized protein n=1 Tax=Schaalia canis TaxID=100469 RepID=A0A3P1SDS5_9ACTO|nr:DUF6301 family protein [Schaalia canis]RRC95127.1 hypothetical protein EII11_06930 [Schaalia canis]